nr:KICSTOR complex protein szt2 [Polyrhizophydium stewartii]
MIEVDSWIMRHMLVPRTLREWETPSLSVADVSVDSPHLSWLPSDGTHPPHAPQQASAHAAAPSEYAYHPSTPWPSDQLFRITEKTVVLTFASRHRLVVLLDVSPSMAVVDVAGRPKVHLSTAFDTICKSFDGLVRPFEIPQPWKGSGLLIEPELLVTVIADAGNAHLPTTSADCDLSMRVLVQEISVTSRNLMSVAERLYDTMVAFENALRECGHRKPRDPIQLAQEALGKVPPIPDGVAPAGNALFGEAHPSTSPPSHLQSQTIQSPYQPPLSGPDHQARTRAMFSAFDAAFLALEQLPNDALPAILYLTDGVSPESDAEVSIPREVQRRIIGDAIRVTIVQVGSGSGFTPSVSFGHVPHTEFLRFVSDALSGVFIYSSDCPYMPDVPESSSIIEPQPFGPDHPLNPWTDHGGHIPANFYHRMMMIREQILERRPFYGVSQRSVLGDIRNRPVDMPRCKLIDEGHTGPDDMEHTGLSPDESAFPWFLGSKPPVIAEILCEYRDYYIHQVRLADVIATRLREGFRVQSIHKSKRSSSRQSSRVEIILAMPWAQNFTIIYIVKMSWLPDPSMRMSFFDHGFAGTRLHIGLHVLGHHAFAMALMNIESIEKLEADGGGERRRQAAITWLDQLLSRWSSMSFDRPSSYIKLVFENPTGATPTGFCAAYLTPETDCIVMLSLYTFGVSLVARRALIDDLVAAIGNIQYAPKNGLPPLHPLTVCDKPVHRLLVRWIWFADIIEQPSHDGTHPMLVHRVQKRAFAQLYNTRLSDGFVPAAESPGCTTFYLQVPVKVTAHSDSPMRPCAVQFALLWNPDLQLLATELWVEPLSRVRRTEPHETRSDDETFADYYHDFVVGIETKDRALLSSIFAFEYIQELGRGVAIERVTLDESTKRLLSCAHDSHDNQVVPTPFHLPSVLRESPFSLAVFHVLSIDDGCDEDVVLKDISQTARSNAVLHGFLTEALLRVSDLVVKWPVGLPVDQQSPSMHPTLDLDILEHIRSVLLGRYAHARAFLLRSVAQSVCHIKFVSSDRFIVAALHEYSVPMSEDPERDRINGHETHYFSIAFFDCARPSKPVKQPIVWVAPENSSRQDDTHARRHSLSPSAGGDEAEEFTDVEGDGNDDDQDAGVHIASLTCDEDGQFVRLAPGFVLAYGGEQHDSGVIGLGMRATAFFDAVGEAYATAFAKTLFLSLIQGAPTTEKDVRRAFMAFEQTTLTVDLAPLLDSLAASAAFASASKATLGGASTPPLANSPSEAHLAESSWVPSPKISASKSPIDPAVDQVYQSILQKHFEPLSGRSKSEFASNFLFYRPTPVSSAATTPQGAVPAPWASTTAGVSEYKLPTRESPMINVDSPEALDLYRALVEIADTPLFVNVECVFRQGNCEIRVPAFDALPSQYPAELDRNRNPQNSSPANVFLDTHSMGDGASYASGASYTSADAASYASENNAGSSDLRTATLCINCWTLRMPRADAESTFEANASSSTAHSDSASAGASTTPESLRTTLERDSVHLRIPIMFLDPGVCLGFFRANISFFRSGGVDIHQIGDSFYLMDVVREGCAPRKYWAFIVPKLYELHLYLYGAFLSVDERVAIVLHVAKLARDCSERANRLKLLHDLKETQSASEYLIRPSQADIAEQAELGMTSSPAVTTSMDAINRERFAPGHFACPLVFEHPFQLHRRLSPALALDAVDSKLGGMAISNRKNFYITSAKSSVYYIQVPSSGHTLRLLVFGVDSPGTEITDEFVAMVHASLQKKTQDQLSESLARNFSIKLTREDVEFIMPVAKNTDPTRTVYYRLPIELENPHLFLLMLRQMLLSFLRPFSGGDVVATLLKHYKRFFRQLVEDQCVRGTVNEIHACDFAFLYNCFNTSRTPTQLEASVGSGLAAVCLTPISPDGKIMFPSRGAAGLQNTKHIDLDNFVPSVAESDTAAMVYMGYKVAVQIWCMGSLNVDALVARISRAFRTTAGDYAVESYFRSTNWIQLPPHELLREPLPSPTSHTDTPPEMVPTPSAGTGSSVLRGAASPEPDGERSAPASAGAASMSRAESATSSAGLTSDPPSPTMSVTPRADVSQRLARHPGPLAREASAESSASTASLSLPVDIAQFDKPLVILPQMLQLATTNENPVVQSFKVATELPLNTVASGMLDVLREEGLQLYLFSRNTLGGELRYVSSSLPHENLEIMLLLSMSGIPVLSPAHQIPGAAPQMESISASRMTQTKGMGEAQEYIIIAATSFVHRIDSALGSGAAHEGSDAAIVTAGASHTDRKVSVSSEISGSAPSLANARDRDRDRESISSFPRPRALNQAYAEETASETSTTSEALLSGSHRQGQHNHNHRSSRLLSELEELHMFGEPFAPAFPIYGKRSSFVVVTMATENVGVYSYNWKKTESERVFLKTLKLLNWCKIHYQFQKRKLRYMGLHLEHDCGRVTKFGEKRYSSAGGLVSSITASSTGSGIGSTADPSIEQELLFRPERKFRRLDFIYHIGSFDAINLQKQIVDCLEVFFRDGHGRALSLTEMSRVLQSIELIHSASAPIFFSEHREDLMEKWTAILRAPRLDDPNVLRIANAKIVSSSHAVMEGQSLETVDWYKQMVADFLRDFADYLQLLGMEHVPWDLASSAEAGQHGGTFAVAPKFVIEAPSVFLMRCFSSGVIIVQCGFYTYFATVNVLKFAYQPDSRAIRNPKADFAADPTTTFLEIEYFLLIVNNESRFPLIDVEKGALEQAIVDDPMREYISGGYYLHDIAKNTEKRIESLVSQATRYFGRDSLWSQLLAADRTTARETAEFRETQTEEWARVFIEKTTPNSRRVSAMDSRFHALVSDRRLPWLTIIEHLAHTNARHARFLLPASSTGPRHMYLINPANSDYMLHFEVGVPPGESRVAVDCLLVSREGIPDACEAAHLNDIVNSVLFFLWSGLGQL